MAGEQPEGSPSPQAQNQLRSQPSNVHSLVRFHNKTMCRADVIWFNYEGQGVRYKTLLPSQSVDVNTYVGHPWVFRDHDTGDRLVVHQEDIFKPEDYGGLDERWRRRRNINITTPVKSLYATCLQQLRNMTYNIPIPRLLGLQEWLPQHVVHELIRNHKIAAIYRRMARQPFVGSSGSSNGVSAAAQEQVGDIENGGDGQVLQGVQNGSNGLESQQEPGSSAGQMQGTGANPAGSGLEEGCSSSSSSSSSKAGGGDQGASQVLGGTRQVHPSDTSLRHVQVGPPLGGGSFVGINRRRLSPASLQARCTAALMSPCTVTTHSRSMDVGAATPPSLSPTSAGPGLLSTCLMPNGGASTSAAAGASSASASAGNEEDLQNAIQVHSTNTTPVHSPVNVSTALSKQPVATSASSQHLPGNSLQQDSATASTSGWTSSASGHCAAFDLGWVSDSAGDTEIDTEDESVNNNHLEAKCCEAAAEKAEENIHLNDNSTVVSTCVNGHDKTDTLDL